MVDTVEDESSGNSIAKDEDAKVSKETDFDHRVPLQNVSRWLCMNFNAYHLI